MRDTLKLKPILCFLAVFAGHLLYGQQSDTLKVRLADLQQRHRALLVNDTAYLKAVDSIAPLLAKEDSLYQLLEEYRDLAFREAARGKFRASYYTYMAINAYNLNRLGSAIYYSERNNAERVKNGQFEKGGIQHSDLFALTVYINSHNYSKAFARYSALRAQLQELAAGVSKGAVSAEQVFVAVNILQDMTYAACELRDTVHVREVMELMEKVLAGVERFPSTYKSHRLLYDYLSHSAYYRYYRLLRQWDAARDHLLAAIKAVNTPGFSPTLQNSYMESLYMDAADLYFDRKQPDSSRYYLGLLTAGQGKVKYSSSDPAFLPEINSRLLAGEGRYEEAYSLLRKVYQTRDSAYYAVSADKDNNLYALAEAENMRAELVRTEEKKRAAQRQSITLFFVLAVLVLVGGTAFWVYRNAAKRRLSDVRLQLARNFHDEIGPMLLYSSMLARKHGDEEQRKQVGRIMEAVRSISNDLKASRLNTIASFGKEVSVFLEKLRAAAGIDFSIHTNNGGQVLGYGQFTQLLAVVSELVSNSARHADCNWIMVRMATAGRQFILHYSDNGKGFEQESVSSGIGMSNIRERVTELKGIFQLENKWPKGYLITVSIPLI